MLCIVTVGKAEKEELGPLSRAHRWEIKLFILHGRLELKITSFRLENICELYCFATLNIHKIVLKRVES